jgi:NodT family efflux transporter outer membrane factor (OMF) lipoprotein
MRVLLACLLVAACTVGPDFKPPSPDTGSHWQNLQAANTLQPMSDPDPDWWRGFSDPELSRLIALGLLNNPDLKQALLRVVEAHEQAVAVAAAKLPTLGGDVSYSYQQSGYKGTFDTFGVPQDFDQLPPDTRGPLDQLLNGLETPVPMYHYGIDSSWELDLFGRVRRAEEAANATAAAQADAANDVLVMLEAEIGHTYLRLRVAQALRQAQQNAVNLATALLALAQQREQLGLGSELDVEQARTTLVDASAALPGYDKQARLAIDALNMLTGNDPGTLDGTLASPRALPAIPALIGIGLPASLARRRPDVREAEAGLHAATAKVGVAVAAFYPDITLNGNAGITALNKNYLATWASIVFAAGPTISLPIFQGGRLTANLRLATAQQKEAALHYRSAVLSALRDAEDAIASYDSDLQTRNDNAAALQVASRSYMLARTRYTLGLADFLQVLSSEQAFVAAQQQLAQADFTLANDVVTLFAALGGGWQESSVKIPPPEISAPLPPLPAALDALGAR